MKRLIRWLDVAFCKLCGAFISSGSLCSDCARKLGNDDTEGYGG